MILTDESPICMALRAAHDLPTRTLAGHMLNASETVIDDGMNGRMVWQAALIFTAMRLANQSVDNGVSTALRAASTYFRNLADTVERIEDALDARKRSKAAEAPR